MKKDRMVAAFLILAVMVLWAYGCASKKISKTGVPVEPAAAGTAKAEDAGEVPTQKYVVKEGDSLWAISRQMGNYSDSFQWPLIFRSNRDQIQDPDQITPGQVLLIQRGHSAEQMKHARQLASDTPAFVSHVEPRETLPVNYF